MVCEIVDNRHDGYIIVALGSCSPIAAAASFDTCPCRFERPPLSSGDATLEPAQLHLKVSIGIMLRTFYFFLLCFCVLFLFACGGNSPANSNANAGANKVSEIKLDPANMPPGISASPVVIAGNNSQGTAANKSLPKGTPTPGIPSEAELKKSMKPGATPTPGIPSPEELKKMMGGKPTGNVNTAPPSMMKKNSNTPPIMKNNKPMGGKPQP